MMEATLRMVRDKFGGAEAYVKKHLSLSDDDIALIKANLLVSAE